MSEEHKIQLLDLDEVVNLGVIQEINRRLLHPRGLALAVEAEVDENGDIESYNSIVGIADYRDVDEPIEHSNVNEGKVEAFDELLE